MSILNPLRGTGRRRAVDALDRARQEIHALENRLRTANAAIDGYRLEQAEFRARIKELRDTIAWQTLGLEEARAETAELEAQNAILRRELQVSREAQQRANAELERLEQTRHDLIDRQHDLEVDNRRLDRQVKGAAETQALDVTQLRAEHAPPVAVAVPLDDDTVTLPVPASAPAPEVHDAETPTRPVASLAALRMATPVRPLRGSTSPTTIPVRTLADMTTGGDAA